MCRRYNRKMNPETQRAEIMALKEARKAVILAHNYQLPEVQDVADFVGDSLALARQAAQTEARVIVFAGVHFMAETAAILNPGKTVLIPDPEAGCSLADTINAADVKAWKEEHPDGIVVAYVNTSAAVKALADVCVTSSNASEMVSKLPKDRPIFFLPDMFLGAHVERETGRKLDIWAGECHVHAAITPEEVELAKAAHPEAELLVHPECGCTSSVRYSFPEAKVCSTEAMVRLAQKSPAQKFLVATEVGIIHRMEQAAPDKTFIPISRGAVCRYMKMITLEKIYLSLLQNRFVVEVPGDTAQAARHSLEAMLAVG